MIYRYDEIQHITNKYPYIKIIDPIDDNVFVDEYRVEQFCKGLIDRKLGINWRANCQFDYYFSGHKNRFLSRIKNKRIELSLQIRL